MKTIEEATEIQGITKHGDGLRLHFSPLPNWYSFQGVDCPRCDQSIEWTWNGKLPGFTTVETIFRSGVTPTVTGAKLIGWGHRSMELECGGCGTKLYADNYD